MFLLKKITVSKLETFEDISINTTRKSSFLLLVLPEKLGRDVHPAYLSEKVTSKIHTLFMTKMVKINTLFMTKTAENPARRDHKYL